MAAEQTREARESDKNLASCIPTAPSAFESLGTVFSALAGLAAPDCFRMSVVEVSVFVVLAVSTFPEARELASRGFVSLDLMEKV